MPINRPKISDNTTPEIISRIFSGDISLDCFLSEYWQKKPLLIRNAFPDFSSPLTPEELAGLACEDDANARIVLEKDNDRSWVVKYGPFDEETFEQLPEDHWSLLVSDVEKHLPSCRNIIDCFRFIPDWRIDDLMISYAPKGGSVGPHLDAYDVFLLQSYGRRKWMINTTRNNNYLENTDLKILADFIAEDEWVLEPGDVLYLPPNIAHHGIATEPCMTCSIGFRAPSENSMVSEFGEYLASKISGDIYYEDKGIQKQEHPAEITQSSLEKIKNTLKKHFVTDNSTIERWFGEYITDTRSSANASIDQDVITDYEKLEPILAENKKIIHGSSSRFAFIRNNNSAILFVDGLSYDTSIKFSEIICASHEVHCATILESIEDDRDRNSLIDLLNRGALSINEARYID